MLKHFSIFFMSCFLFSQILADNEDISPYCKKSSVYKYSYPPTPVPCCNDESRCPEFIKPGETKYGVTNSDVWWVRHCSCEHNMYKCLAKEMSESDLNTAYHYFKQLSCFDTDDSCRENCGENYKMYYVQDKILKRVQFL